MSHNLPVVSPSLPSPLSGSYILPMNKTSSSSCKQKNQNSTLIWSKDHTCINQRIEDRPYMLTLTYSRVPIFAKFLCMSPSIIQFSWGVSNFSSFHRKNKSSQSFGFENEVSSYSKLDHDFSYLNQVTYIITQTMYSILSFIAVCAATCWYMEHV